MLDDARLGQRAEGAALARGDVVAPHGQAADMRLVDHRAVPGGAGIAVVAPGEAVVHHHALRHGRRAVAAVEGQVGAAAARAVAEQHVGPAQLAVQLPGIGVEQQLVRVEAVAVPRLVRAIGAVAVELARAGLPAGSRARPRRCIPAAAAAPISRRPEGSKRQRSIRSAFAEKTAKLTPSPSQFAPSGSGRAGQQAGREGRPCYPCGERIKRGERRQEDREAVVEAVARHRFGLRSRRHCRCCCRHRRRRRCSAPHARGRPAARRCGRRAAAPASGCRPPAPAGRPSAPKRS